MRGPGSDPSTGEQAGRRQALATYPASARRATHPRKRHRNACCSRLPVSENTGECSGRIKLPAEWPPTARHGHTLCPLRSFERFFKNWDRALCTLSTASYAASVSRLLNRPPFRQPPGSPSTGLPGTARRGHGGRGAWGPLGQGPTEPSRPHTLDVLSGKSLVHHQ